MYTGTSRQASPPWLASAIVTAGLKWAPEIAPKVMIKATSPAPVAIVFASNAIATLPPARRLAHDARADYGGEQECRAEPLGTARLPNDARSEVISVSSPWSLEKAGSAAALAALAAVLQR